MENVPGLFTRVNFRQEMSREMENVPGAFTRVNSRRDL